LKSETKYRFSSFSVIVVFACLSIVGLSLVPLLRLQLNPSRGASGFSVSYNWPGASAQIIEQEVSSRLEGLFTSVKGVSHISSVSSKGTGRINLGFKKNVSLDAVRFEVASLIRQVHPELPKEVSYPQISADVSGNRTEPVLTYTLRADLTPMHIQKYGEEFIVPVLRRVPGVQKVDIYGAAPFEWVIEFDDLNAHFLGIKGDDIAAAVENYFRKDYGGRGSFLLPGHTLLNESSLVIQCSRSDSIGWENIPVKKNGERIVFLKDVARIKYREQSPDNFFRINGFNTINIVIYPEEGVNVIKLGRTVKGVVQSVRDNLPQAFSLMLSDDATAYLSKELNKIGLRTLFSLLILLILILLVSRQFRYLLIILFSISANLLISCIFFYLFKIELQLYSLAGLTISFGIILDNSIVMIDHWRHHKNRKVFLAVLAATLTTIGALATVFFLEEEQKLNLIDFVWVIIINLLVSMTIALFFIPALMDNIRLPQKSRTFFYRRRRRLVKFTRLYMHVLLLCKRWKRIFLIALILGFGLPVHLLPEKLDGEEWWNETYNLSLGSSWFIEEAKPVLEKALGGALRLFAVDVFDGSFYAAPERTTLYVRGKMPEGCTVTQLNKEIRKMENYLSQYSEIEMFRTEINSYSNSGIVITFKPEHEYSRFPYFLKSALESYAISQGGMDWSVYGVGKGFSNAVHSGFKNSRVYLEGYNYEQLYSYAEKLKDMLLENARIQDVEITGSDGWSEEISQEFSLKLDAQKLALYGTSQEAFYSFLRDKAYKRELPPVYRNHEAQQVFLTSGNEGVFNLWEFNNGPVIIADKLFKMEQFGKIEKGKTGNDIYKNNQQYRLFVSYDFNGPAALSDSELEKYIEKLNHTLPVGFEAKEAEYPGWNKKDKDQYYLLLLSLGIIFFICAILLESFLQPFAVLFLIPVSFIGLFLTFYLFDLNFDQGGFAAFILLSGLSVNSGLFIINDFNNYRKAKGKLVQIRAYMKAFNHKIIPVLLTLTSTIVGLIPFIWYGQKEVFWFAFAAGSIGGLLFSMVAILIYLPLFLNLSVGRDGPGLYTDGA
jgi:multidrug efflux pump subunit AcrB